MKSTKKYIWIAVSVVASLILGFVGVAWPAPQFFEYSPLVPPPSFLSKVEVTKFSSILSSFNQSQETGATENTINEPEPTYEPSLGTYIATINAPDTAILNQEFAVNWDCPDAESAVINQNGDEILEPSGSLKFTVSTAGSIDFGLTCTWPDGETVSQIKTTQVVVFESATTELGCSLTDGTAQIKVEQVGNEYIVDPANLKVVAGYNNTLPGHDATNLSGCDMWSEYESPSEQVHMIDVLRDEPGTELAYLGDDGKYHFPSPMGGSFWVGPADWNTADFTTQKPPIAYEMAAAKNANQKRNGYDWSEVIRLPDGVSIKTFEIGYEYGSFYSGCTDITTTSPLPVYVAGTILEGGGYNASIGMEGCLVAVKLDGVWTLWADARDNVLYETSASAYLFRKGTTKEQVQDWIDSQ